MEKLGPDHFQESKDTVARYNCGHRKKHPLLLCRVSGISSLLVIYRVYSVIRSIVLAIFCYQFSLQRREFEKESQQCSICCNFNEILTILYKKDTVGKLSQICVQCDGFLCSLFVKILL